MSEEPAPPSDSRGLHAAGLLLVALSTLALGVYAFGWHRVGDTAAESDFFTGYVIGARQLLHGHLDFGRFGVFGPVYEALLALFGLVVRDLFSAARLLSVLSAGATMLAWWSIARRAWGSVAAFFVVALLVVNPTFARYGYSATTDAPGLALFSLAAWTLLVPGGRWRLAGAGVLAGLATLTRYNLVMILPAGILLLAAGAARAPRERGVAITKLTGGFLLVVVPWTLASLAAGHVPGITLLRDPGFYEARDPSEVLENRYRDIEAGIHAAPPPGAADSSRASRIVTLARGVATHVRLDALALVGLPAALLSVLGIVVALARRRLRELAAPLVLGAFAFLPLVPVFYSLRYALVLLPMEIAPGAWLLATLVHAPRPRPWTMLAAGALALAALAPTAWWSYRLNAEWLAEQPREARAAGEAVRAHVEPGARLLARKGHAAYFAGLAPVPFPIVDSLDVLAKYCRAENVRYLYFSTIEARARPDFVYLLDTSAVVPGLSVLYAATDPPAIVYAVGPGFGAAPPWWEDTATLRRVNARVHVLLDPGAASRGYSLELAADGLDRGRPAEALRDAEVAARLAPALPDAKRLEAEALRRLGRGDAAIETLRVALALAPEDSPTRLGLGMLLAEAGRDSEAAATWRPVVGLTRDPHLLDAMERVYSRLGDRAALARLRAGSATNRMTAN